MGVCSSPGTSPPAPTSSVGFGVLGVTGRFVGFLVGIFVGCLVGFLVGNLVGFGVATGVPSYVIVMSA